MNFIHLDIYNDRNKLWLISVAHYRGVSSKLMATLYNAAPKCWLRYDLAGLAIS